MNRRRFLYKIAGAAVGMLMPGEVLRASAAAPEAEGGLLLPAVHDTVPAASSTIYLTFDDGYIGIAEKVAALNALGVAGTFFLAGQAIYNNPRSVANLVNSGHVLGNHTYSHANLTGLSYGRIQAELQRCEDAALNTVGVSTLPLLRPPWGYVNASVRSAAATMGFQNFLWNWDTRDWAGSSASHIERNVGSGIVLMHTQGRNTVSALYDVVPALAAQGYTFAVL
ncbi:MAG: polysaccharide deacetylase family protein [Dehalococcoidia bacterium]